MSTLAMDYPRVLLTSPLQLNHVPSWIPRKFSPEVVLAKDIRDRDSLEKLTIVRASGLKSVLKSPDFLALLAERLQQTPGPAKIVFVLDAAKKSTDAQQLLEVLMFFQSSSDVEFVRGVGEAEFALAEALAKIWADSREMEPASGGSAPLKDAKNMIASTSDLRTTSGRLSASKIARVFGLSLNQLAFCLNTSRQALHKTPDSKNIQKGLAPFERIARLRTALNPEEFRAWLNMPNHLLDDHIPAELIEGARVDVVANLAEDMLSGSPS